MQYKYLIPAILVLIFLAGCTQQEDNTNQGLNEELSCPIDQEICILGSPGLLNEMSIYSDANTVFSIILRNNLKGDEANNVEVKLKNLSPFYVVEGYDLNLDTYASTTNPNIMLEYSCNLKEGMWKPSDIRQSLYVPEPQFISDLGLPFASKMLDVMYPNEEVEFLWNLKTPSRQEIANVAYEHSIDFEVSYDYKTNILQTLYAVSEQEYQRMLSLGEDLANKKGTITTSIGALNVESITEEPIRVTGPNSQFSMTFKVNNKRSGIPLTPALFVFQYPNGTDFIGAFNDEYSLNSYGYIDLKAAAEKYSILTDSAGGDKRVCIPSDFDVYDSVFKTILVDEAYDNLICPSYDQLLDYIIRNYKDLEINKSSPNLVLKFLYPINLVNEMNYLYYPMITTENVDVSKYYTFRLKAKYRYSFSGNDEIIIIPSEQFYEPTVESQTAYFFGDMGFNMDKIAKTHTLNNETLEMTRDEYAVNSSVFELKTGDFLQIFSLDSAKAPLNKTCENNDDCVFPNIYPSAYCDNTTMNLGVPINLCNYTYNEENITRHNFDKNLESYNLKNWVISNANKGESTEIEFEYNDICNNSQGNLYMEIFGKLISGNYSLFLKAAYATWNIQPTINNQGEFYIHMGPLVVNCTPDSLIKNRIVFNSTYDGSEIVLYDLVLRNSTKIIKQNYLDTKSTTPNSDYLKFALTPGQEVFMDRDFDFKKDETFNHYIYYKMGLGEIKYSLNSSGTLLLSNNWIYSNAKYTAKNDGNTIQLKFKNENNDSDAIIYLSQKSEAGKLNSFNYSIFNEKNATIREPFFYNVKVGYSPLDNFLKKIFDTGGANIRLDKTVYYINHLPFISKNKLSKSTMNQVRTNISTHNLSFEDTDTVIVKTQKLKDFIDYKSFIELNELNFLKEEVVNVFSDNDFIGYQLKDYDYTTPAYLNTMPMSMKIMSYYEGETVYFKRFYIGEAEDNAFSLVILYSDKMDNSTNRLMFYVIDHKLSVNNPVQANYFNVSLVKGNDITTLGVKKLFLNNTLVPTLRVGDFPYKEISTLYNLRGVTEITDCSVNYNIFGQSLNKKPIMIIDYEIKYGTIEPLNSFKGSVVIGDYASTAEVDQNFNNIMVNKEFVRGVVTVCNK